MPLAGIPNGAIQTSWDAHPNQGVPGLLTYLNRPHDYVSAPVESPFIAFGSAVAKGTTITNRPNEWGTTHSPYKLAAASATTTAADLVGILAFNNTGAVGPNPFMIGNEAGATAGKFELDYACLVRLGFVHVKNYADTTEGAAAFMVINATNSLNARIGEFVTTELGGAAIEIPQVVWDSSDLNSMNATSVVRVNFTYGLPA
jgi:hypothetical protein